MVVLVHPAARGISCRAGRLLVIPEAGALIVGGLADVVGVHAAGQQVLGGCHADHDSRRRLFQVNQLPGNCVVVVDDSFPVREDGVCDVGLVLDLDVERARIEVGVHCHLPERYIEIVSVRGLDIVRRFGPLGQPVAREIVVALRGRALERHAVLEDVPSRVVAPVGGDRHRDVVLDQPELREVAIVHPLVDAHALHDAGVGVAPRRLPVRLVRREPGHPLGQVLPVHREGVALAGGQRPDHHAGGAAL
mmetsp:Transcript_19412/g.57047  ORF Transcript_19412/g.57047 Transcript_19412/m.57047 type:complete len:249 (-) Transcript_19412:927-1673(-)